MTAGTPPVRKLKRWVRSVAYAAVAVSGIFIVVLEAFGPYYKAMGVWCIVGGLCSLVGALTGRWPGEYLGLPLVSSALFTLAGITYRDAWPVAHYVAVPSILLLVGFGLLCIPRWVDVATVERAASAQAKARARGVGHDAA